MKKIYNMLLALGMVSFSFLSLTSCSEEEPFSTATEDDSPRILDPIFQDRINGELPVVANINRTDTFAMTLTVTPADYTTVTWYIDGQEVATGTEIKRLLPAGSYPMKVVASTAAGKSTYREGIVRVNPIDGDPWSSGVGFERIVAPGTQAVIYGENLSKVISLSIGEHNVTDIQYDAGTESLRYTVPSDMTPGDYRLTLMDSEGHSYGADKVKVTDEALVTAGASRANANAAWTLSGVNLDQIASLSLGGQTVTTFISLSTTEITVTCPALSDGNYTLTGKTKDGKDVIFFVNGTTAVEQTVAVTSETTLWEGHHYVSWDLPDESPNKKFDLVEKDRFATITAGSTLRIYYSLKADDAYHQMQTVTGWWTLLPGTDKQDLMSDGVLSLVLTQPMLDLIQAQDGFLVVGHGYYVDRVSIQ
ncbi:MAG: hypothetical protein I3J02_05020 [Prevotella sp.]|nr:hypothetical protein [Prevotella sp.]